MSLGSVLLSVPLELSGQEIQCTEAGARVDNHQQIPGSGTPFKGMKGDLSQRLSQAWGSSEPWPSLAFLHPCFPVRSFHLQNWWPELPRVCALGICHLGSFSRSQLKSFPKVKIWRCSSHWELRGFSCLKPWFFKWEKGSAFWHLLPQHRALRATSLSLGLYSEAKEKRSVKPLVLSGVG